MRSTPRFKTPSEVLEAKDLTTAQKLRALESWEYDCRELEVAEWENMGGGEPSQLDSVLEALRALRGATPPEDLGATKQGGRVQHLGSTRDTSDEPREGP